MSKEKQIEEMAEELRHSCEGECFRNKDGFIDCEVCEALLLYNAGYRKQSEAEWIPYSNIVGERQITGWLCGNCKKYSTGLRKYCPECGAKMKGV